MDSRTRASALGSNVLRTAPRDVATALLQKSRSLTRAEGERLFAQGDRARDLFIVLSGWIKLVREEADGEASVVEVFAAGESFAEAPAILDDRYPVTAEAVSDATVLAIPGGAVRDMLAERPEMAISMIAAAYHRMQGLLREVRQLKGRTAAQRLAGFLLDTAHRTAPGSAVDLPFEKGLIAARLGMTPSTLSRSFRRLRDFGVEVRAGSATVSDFGALKTFAESTKYES